MCFFDLLLNVACWFPLKKKTSFTCLSISGVRFGDPIQAQPTLQVGYHLVWTASSNTLPVGIAKGHSYTSFRQCMKNLSEVNFSLLEDSAKINVVLYTSPVEKKTTGHQDAIRTLDLPTLHSIFFFLFRQDLESSVWSRYDSWEWYFYL